MVRKIYSTLFSIIFNKIFCILFSIPSGFILIMIIKENLKFKWLLYLIVLLIFLLYLYIFVFKMKYLFREDGFFYINLFRSHKISDFKAIFLLNGRVPLLFFSYILNNKKKWGVTIVKTFRSKEIFKELKKLSAIEYSRN